MTQKMSFLKSKLFAKFILIFRLENLKKIRKIKLAKQKTVLRQLAKNISEVNNEILESQSNLDDITVENTQKGVHVNDLKRMIGLRAKSSAYNIISNSKSLAEP